MIDRGGVTVSAMGSIVSNSFGALSFHYAWSSGKDQTSRVYRMRSYPIYEEKTDSVLLLEIKVIHARTC